jgi:hypothetical protein
MNCLSRNEIDQVSGANDTCLPYNTIITNTVPPELIIQIYNTTNCNVKATLTFKIPMPSVAPIEPLTQRYATESN